MKDFVSKLTFGFLMAQLFPGAVAVFGIAFTYSTWESAYIASVLGTSKAVLASWDAATLPQRLFLVALCVGAGMFIHGLHWAVLGALERDDRSIFDADFHKKFQLWLQVLCGPLRMLQECAELFFCNDDLRGVKMNENVPKIDKDHMEQFDFVQEFYLASCQFFLHMSYGLIVLLASLISFGIAYGPTFQRVLLVLLVYVFTGVFFILGRIQLCSLINAEEALAKRSAPYGAAASARSDDERLQKLKDLLQKALISQEEHDQRKASILDKVCA